MPMPDRTFNLMDLYRFAFNPNVYFRCTITGKNYKPKYHIRVFAVKDKREIALFSLEPGFCCGLEAHQYYYRDTTPDTTIFD